MVSNVVSALVSVTVSTSPAFVRSSHPGGPHGRIAKKRENWPPLLGAGMFDTICTGVCDRCDSSTASRLCRLEPLTALHYHHYESHFYYIGVGTGGRCQFRNTLASPTFGL